MRQYTRHEHRCGCSGCSVFWGLVDFVVRLANEAAVRRALPDPVVRSKALQEILDSKSQGSAPYQWGDA